MRPIVSRRELFRLLGVGAALAGLGASRSFAAPDSEALDKGSHPVGRGVPLSENRGVVAVPTKIPAPIKRSHAIHNEIEIEAREVDAEIEPGAKFSYMTYDGQVPGPMMRVRVGDTVTLTLRNNAHSSTWHSIDLHAVYRPDGGAEPLMVLPGQSKTIKFKAMYPGAFIYHCGVPGMDEHMARGMFGMIVVEPEEGLPHVDREFYLGQNETYTRQKPGIPGSRDFDFDALLREDPSYVTFNGGFNALTAKRLGAMHAKVGESVRIFMVNTGPNLLSSLHPIGNIWTRAWMLGALAMPPMKFVQSVPVPPGNAIVADMELPVPQTIQIVDHSMSRAARQGAVAEIVVTGEENPQIFDSQPLKSAAAG